MANTRTTRKMPADVKRTLTDRRQGTPYRDHDQLMGLRR